MTLNRTPYSLETILTFDNRDAQSQWSEIWSTAHIPGMDNASGGATQRGVKGRRKLTFGSLALGGFLTMHCRVIASALTGGFFIFLIFLVMVMALLGNPLRHFEVYLGQWSISGPGRAFRILPVFEGIGIAICINAILRAMVCCTVAAIAGIYFLHAVSDSKLPYKYCRDFNLRTYDPIIKNINIILLREAGFTLAMNELDNENLPIERTTLGTKDFAWRNASHQKFFKNRYGFEVFYPICCYRKRNADASTLYIKKTLNSLLSLSILLCGIQSRLVDTRSNTNTSRRSFDGKLEICNELYTTGYPILYSTPPYNFFYVEVVLFRDNYNFGQFNVPLMLCIIFIWCVLWAFLIMERLLHGRLVWNNTNPWLAAVPWIWTIILLLTASAHLVSAPKMFYNANRIGAKEVLTAFADALEVALYIHSAGVGTEIIHGKGLNHYASGHIDPNLNGENIWHTGLLLLLTGLNTSGAAICAIVDSIQPNTKAVYSMRESTLWIFPLYSSCTLINNYSHLASALIFGGLMFSYTTVAYVLIKTSLHAIFEYNIRLVFAEQFVVAGIILTCMGLSMFFASTGGIALLESIDTIMTGVSTPFICLLELLAMLYFYRSHDFVSDMNIATEENACSSRIGTQWQIIPIIMLGTLILKLTMVWSAEMPAALVYGASAALAAVAAAPALRALRNAHRFLAPRRSK